MVKMRDIIIREVEPSDYEDIYELNCLLGYEYPKDKTKQRILHILINTKDTALVAVLNREIVGYIHGSPYEVLYSDSFMDVLGLAVKEKFKGVGIGYLLLNRLENVAKERTFRGIRLVTGYNRVLAHKFYERQGYVNRKDQKNYCKIFD